MAVQRGAQVVQVCGFPTDLLEKDLGKEQMVVDAHRNVHPYSVGLVISTGRLGTRMREGGWCDGRLSRLVVGTLNPGNYSIRGPR